MRVQYIYVIDCADILNATVEHRRGEIESLHLIMVADSIIVATRRNQRPVN